ncbi:MAG: NfeD family protein [Candidatus Anammoxibacter sp.]
MIKNYKKICFSKRILLYVIFILVSIPIISTQDTNRVGTSSLIADDVIDSRQTTPHDSKNASVKTSGHFEDELPDKLPEQEAVSTVSPKPVFIITLHGMIDGGLSGSLDRRINVAKDNGADMIIFDINTFGGRLDSAIEISESISSIKDIKTVAFISHKAISAGALIAISCNDIIMAPEAEFGDCEPILPSSEGGYKTAGEKIQTVLRTKFRKFAEKNGYPVLLAEAMVTSEIEVYRVVTDENPSGVFMSSRELKEMNEDEKGKIKKKKLIVEEGKLLTMHAKEALEYGFARHIVDDRAALLALYNLNENETLELAINWSEKMVRVLEKIAPFLMTIGIIAIYLEFKTPGFGLPGIVGILCFATMFLTKYSVGLAEMPEIIIFIIGIALIATEIFLIPGFGIAGIAGIVFVFVGLLLSFQDFTLPHTPYDSEVLRENLLVIIGSFISASFAIVLLLRYMPGIPMFNRLILTTSETTNYGFKSVAITTHSDLVGSKGIAITPLHPSGRIEIGEFFYDVVSQGGFIDKGQTVEVIEETGNHIVVKAV